MRSLRTEECGKPRPLRWTPVWEWVLAGLAVLVLLPVMGEGLLHGQSQASPQPAAAYPIPVAQPPVQPPANQADCPGDGKPAQDGNRTENRGIKTRKDTLSVAVIRKAGEIEQLAHRLRSSK
ncbi:MAG: hypothetical protein P4K94_11195 [Terracidiphilus sp.]|nr:hypothetical protein [Terracidiphilus sp.]